MFSKIALALFAAVAAAQRHAATTLLTTQLAIYRPERGNVLEIGKPFTITWAPDYNPAGTVSLVLLTNAPSNVQPAGAIAEGIPNSGSFIWTPTDANGANPTFFGIQIISDVDGAFQYSVNFGLSYPEGYQPTPSETPSSSPIVTGQGYETIAPPTSTPTSTAYPTDITTVHPPAPTGYPTGVLPGNSTIIQPSVPLSVPSSLRTTTTQAPTTTGSDLPESTGAAAQLKAGAGLVAGVAAIFFML